MGDRLWSVVLQTSWSSLGTVVIEGVLLAEFLEVGNTIPFAVVCTVSK